MAVAGLRSLSDADKRTQALKLFEQVIGQPTFPEDALARIKNQVLAGFEYQKQNPGKLAGCSSASMASIPTRTPATATKSPFHRSAANNCRRSTRKPYAAGNVVIALVGDPRGRRPSDRRRSLQGAAPGPGAGRPPSRKRPSPA